jgi:branched-chain amino acid transport system substrate-binding protein
MRSRTGQLLGAALALSCAAATTGLTLGNQAASAASGKAPITIAMITSLTGVAGPQFSDSPAGFDARIALANAHGGVDGHKLVPLVLDDQTSPTGVVNAVQLALSKGVFGIVSTSPLFFIAAKYPNQAGVPVTGGSFDGPEWGQQPYTNMFAADTGSVDPKYPVNSGAGVFFKSKGATTLGSYGYGISPSSARSAVGTADSFQRAGGKVGVLDTSVPFGSVEFTPAALTAKSHHVDAIYAGMDNNSNFALATAYKDAGVKLKAVIFPTGLEPDIVGTPAWQSVQGDYFPTTFRPTSIPDAGTRAMVAALQKYAHRPPAKFPTFNVYESWLGADLMIKGLELAGPNPNRASVIQKLRALKSYNGEGLLPQTINYSTIFGHDLPKLCQWYMRAEPHGFVPVSTQPMCGTDVAGTTTASSS